MLQNSGGIANEQVKLLQLLSNELIKNVEGRLHTDSYSEKIILKESHDKEEAMKKIKRSRRNGLLMTPRCNRLCFNFDMCNEMYHEIASYLELRDLIAFTTTCRKAADTLQGYRLNVNRFQPATYSWVQRCKILQSSATNHTLLGNVHERDSPVSSIVAGLKDRFFVLGGYDGNISIWESNPDPMSSLFPTCRKIVKAHDGWVLSLTKISSSTFASSCIDGSVKIWCIESILGVNFEDATNGYNIQTTAMKMSAKPKSKVGWMKFIFGRDNNAKDTKYMFTGTPLNYRLYNGVSVENSTPLATVKTTPELVEGICSIDSSLFVADTNGSLSKHRIMPAIAADEVAKSEPNKSSVISSLCHSLNPLVNEEEDCHVRNVTILKSEMLVGISRKGGAISIFEGNKWVTAWATRHGSPCKDLCALPSGGFIVWFSRGYGQIFHDVDRAPFNPDPDVRLNCSVEISAMFALDDKYIVIGGVDHSLSLYDLQTAQMVRTVREAHSSFVTSIAYLQNARCIISSSLDGSVRVTKLDAFGFIKLGERADTDDEDSHTEDKTLKTAIPLQISSS